MVEVFGMRKFDHGSRLTTVRGIFKQAVYFHGFCVDTQLQRPWTKASALRTDLDTALKTLCFLDTCRRTAGAYMYMWWSTWRPSPVRANPLSWRGDLIGARGFPGKMKAGELSVSAASTVLLSPCLPMLPPAEESHRHAVPAALHRPAALKTQHTFSTCSKIIAFVRQFLVARAPGGGDADAEQDGGRGRGHALPDMAQGPGHPDGGAGIDMTFIWSRLTTIRVFASAFSFSTNTKLPGQDPKSSGLHPVCVCDNILCFVFLLPRGR